MINETKIKKVKKTIHKSHYAIDKKNIKTNISFNPINKIPYMNNKYGFEYEYDKFLFLRKKKIKNKIKVQDHYLDKMKEKYFIRGLALNKESAFYYNKCKRVDFSENEEKNKEEKYIYINKLFNKNKLYLGDNKNKISNINKNNIIFRSNKLMVNYSLKNLLNNKIPVIFGNLNI